MDGFPSANLGSAANWTSTFLSPKTMPFPGEVPSPDLRVLTILIGHYGLDPVTIAVEINGEIPKRDQWSSIALKESDRIEFIRFVGGG